MRLITWQRLYSKHEERHIAALWSTHGPVTFGSSLSREATFTFTLCFKLAASILWPRLEGHMCVFVVICWDISTASEASQSTAKCCDDAHLLFNRVNNKAQWILVGLGLVELKLSVLVCEVKWFAESEIRFKARNKNMHFLYIYQKYFTCDNCYSDFLLHHLISLLNNPCVCNYCHSLLFLNLLFNTIKISIILKRRKAR